MLFSPKRDGILPFAAVQMELEDTKRNKSGTETQMSHSLICRRSMLISKRQTRILLIRFWEGYEKAQYKKAGWAKAGGGQIEWRDTFQVLQHNKVALVIIQP